MSLFTKSILKPSDPKDGVRISVMSRHTLNDGVTPDDRIRNFDEHIPILGPSPKLVGDYYKRNLPWSEFEARYTKEIGSGPALKIVESIAKRALTQDITLLCIEDTAEQCHRRLLAETCKKYAPKLHVEHH